MLQAAIIIGSDSDWPIIEPGYKQLQDFGISCEVLVASAHRTPDVVKNFVSTARQRGIKVIIAAAGAAAHLPGVVAAYTTLPVIGVPISGSPLKGFDALFSIVQMPPGIPVGTMAVDGGKNAALYAASILALNDESISAKLDQFRIAQADNVMVKNQTLQNKLKP